MKNKTQQYLQTKRTIEANYQGLKQARDLPNDHQFGVKSGLDAEHNMSAVVRNEYVGDHQVKFASV